MERYPAQPSYELVLDARRLIIACALVIFVCGVFFILGFVEGKRQVLQASLTEREASRAAATVPGTPGGESAAVQPAATPPESPAKPAPEQQSWYDTVNARREQAEPQPRSDATTKPNAAVKPAVAPVSAKPAVASPVSSPKPAGAAFYSCQVGAFRQQKEAQIKADELKKRGYAFVIEAPESEGGLFLLKVGRYATRAEAVAMQARLKKSGYDSFIKTSR